MSDLPYRLRQTFKAWGIRSLGDEAADEIDRLREALALARTTCGLSNCNCVGAKKVRDAIDKADGALS